MQAVNRRLVRVLAATVVAGTAVQLSAQSISAASPASPDACAALVVRATPKINAQNAPFETIRNTVTNCSTNTETVRLSQRIAGPFASFTITNDASWIITLGPGATVQKVQHIPYSCCGSFTVTDTVTSRSGRVLAVKRTGFTFA
jgi:hypothetical protein